MTQFKKATQEMVENIRDTKYAINKPHMAKMEVMDYFEVDCTYEESNGVRCYYFGLAYKLNFTIKTAYNKHAEVLTVIRIK